MNTNKNDAYAPLVPEGNVGRLIGLFDSDGVGVDIYKPLDGMDIDCQNFCPCCGWNNISHPDDAVIIYDVCTECKFCDFCNSEIEKHSIIEDDVGCYLYTNVIEDCGLPIRKGYLRQTRIDLIFKD